MRSEAGTAITNPEKQGVMGVKFIRPFVGAVKDAVKGVIDSLTKKNLPNTDEAFTFRVYRGMSRGLILGTLGMGIIAMSAAWGGNPELGKELGATALGMSVLTGIMAAATRRAYLDVK